MSKIFLLAIIPIGALFLSCSEHSEQAKKVIESSSSLSSSSISNPKVVPEVLSSSELSSSSIMNDSAKEVSSSSSFSSAYSSSLALKSKNIKKVLSSSSFLNLSSSTAPMEESPSSSSSELSSSSSEIVLQGLTDPRDNQNYKTVKIGNQVWMAENLNFKTENSYCYEDSEENCNTYGRLYTWDAATTACPSGWHLPNNAEWDELVNFISENQSADKNTVATYLKSQKGWSKAYENPYEFSALPAGYRFDDGFFTDKGGFSSFWTASAAETDKDIAYYRDLYSNREGLYSSRGYKNFAFSARCIKKP